MREPPAYQEYASDILATEWYKNMPLETRGLWHSMRLMCWVNKSIPLDSQELALHIAVPAPLIDENLPMVLRHFKEQPSGRLINPELEAYRKKLLEDREKRSKSGKKGGRASHRTSNADKDFA